jgi:hypothetical protein
MRERSALRGRGECRVPAAPVASRGKNSNHTSIVTTVTAGFTRHSRTRMVLTAYFVLFPAIGLSCHRRRRDAKHRRQLDASVETSEPHDFAVRAAPFVFQRTRVHRIPRPTFVTIAKRPSNRARDARRSASDLPDITSESVCDTMARRANHARRRSEHGTQKSRTGMNP